MDNHFVPIFLNYDRFMKENSSGFSRKELFNYVKVLLIRSGRFLTPVYEIPSIKSKSKQNSKQIIVDNFDKITGVNGQGISKSFELNFYNTNEAWNNHSPNLSLTIFLMKSDEIKMKSQFNSVNSDFISMNDASKINLNDKAKEIISNIIKWIEKDCMSRNSLQKWFNSSYNKTVSIMDSDTIAGNFNNEIKQKSTSLDTISFQLPRPQSAIVELSKKKQADSLDQLSQKYDKKMISNTGNSKIKISKQKPVSITGPITAMPLKESVDLYMTNNLINQAMDYESKCDIVIENPFWNQRKPDLNRINRKANTLFDQEKNVFRNRSWFIDFPLHYASYKGELLQVSPLLNKGYKCTQKDSVGWTPMHYAVWYGHKDIVLLFLQSSYISVNTRTNDYLTPLHITVYKGNVEIAALLLKQLDINTTIKTHSGEDARSLSERLKTFSISNLLKSVVPKLSKIPVYLMDNNVIHLVLTRGIETTFQNLKMQLFDVLDLSNSSVDIFSFWIGFRTPKLTGKYFVIPIQCFGDLTITLKEINFDDFKIYWKRNVLLDHDTEIRVKDLKVISLLFEEAVENFTTKSLYPCDSKDVVLLSSVLLYLHLPNNIEKPEETNRRTSSLSRINRPLSFVFGSNPDMSNQNFSNSLLAFKDLSSSKVKDSKPFDKTLMIKVRKRQANQFLSNEKNLQLITPKRKIKNRPANFIDDIMKHFSSSPFISRSYNVEEIKYRFLILCWNLTLYGCAYFDVEIKLQSSLPFFTCIFAVNDMGVYIIHGKTKSLIQNFKYSSISWNSTESKYLVLFTIKGKIFIKSKLNMMIDQLMMRLHAMNPA